MTENSVTRRLFAATLAKWAHAVECGDIECARFQLEQLNSVRRMMVIHPDFRRALLQSHPQLGIETCSEVVQAFLAAATEMHAVPANRI